MTWMESKVSVVGVIAGLAGMLLGAGISLGTAYTRLGAIESRLDQIQDSLRERTTANTTALAGHETRIRMLEIEQARMMKGSDQ